MSIPTGTRNPHPDESSRTAAETPEDDWLDEPDDDAGDRDAEATSLEMFEHDTGTLDADERRALITLLKTRYITPASHPDAWRTTVEHEALLRSRLHDLMLDLRLDTSRGIAHKRQITSDEAPAPKLLREASYTREETILLVYLRQRYRTERSAGAEHVIVDRDDLTAAVSGYRPPTATDQATDVRRVQNAIETLTKARILARTSDDERLEISAVIEVLLPLGLLAELLDWLIGQNTSEDGPAVSADPDDEEE